MERASDSALDGDIERLILADAGVAEATLPQSSDDDCGSDPDWMD